MTESRGEDPCPYLCREGCIILFTRSRFRRGGLFALALLLVVSLIGCSKGENRPPVTFKGELTLWAAPGLAGVPSVKPGADWFQEQIKAYESAHSGITVRLELFSTPAELEQALVAPDRKGRSAPDLVFGRFLPEVATGLADLDAIVSSQVKADYLPNALDSFRSGGKLRGLPALVEVQVLALNETAFAEAGVSLPDGGKWDWAEFERALAGLSNKSRSGLGYYQLPGYHEWWPLADGVLTADGTVDPGLESGLDRLLRYRRAGWLHADTGKVSATEIWSLFAKKPAAIAMLPVGTWAVPLLRQEPYSVKLSVAGFPGGRTTGYSYGVSVLGSKDSARLNAAADFAAVLTSLENQAELARLTGLLPTRKSAGNPFGGDQALSRAYELASTQRPLPAGPRWDQAEVAIVRELNYATLGAKSSAAVLEQIRKEAESASAPAAR